MAELADYIEAVRPQLLASGEAHSVLRFVLAPPMATVVVVGTPARPAWAGIAALAVGALPRWARRLYRLPGLPTTDLATSAGLYALRTATLALPAGLREGPHLKAARARLLTVPPPASHPHPGGDQAVPQAPVGDQATPHRRVGTRSA